MSTETELLAKLEEQNRLLRKADRRGGCLWNLVMLVLFGVFYLAWLIGKWVVKLVILAAMLVWRLLRAIGRALAAGAAWARRKVRPEAAP